MMLGLSGPSPLIFPRSYLLFVSGIEFGATLSSTITAPPLELSTQLLADFISGRLGGSHDVALASRITR